MVDKALLIVGAGSQAGLAINTARAGEDFDILGLIDVCDNPSIWGNEIDGVTILGDVERLKDFRERDNLYLFVAVGDQESKQRMLELLAVHDHQFATLIHPRACIAPSVTFGVGCLVNAGVVVEPNARIGAHVVIRAGCIVSHDVCLEDCVSLSPGVTLAGRSQVKKSGVIYSGATLAPGVIVGEGAVVGAGSVALKNVPPGATVLGVPARAIKGTRGRA